MPLSPGERLGPYEIVAPIGAGGMGEVYKARDTRLDRVVAIKVSQDDFGERFRREARAIAALNHPNICQIFDVGPNYFVMEHIEGSPVAAGGSVRKLLDIAAQIADGLSAAHAAGIIHRDLKPDNVLLTRDGRVKILDFGLAKAAAVSARAGTATQTMAITDPGTTVGTIFYMSPEQARGDPELTPQSDQFSFGLLLYELATGKRAFQRGSAPETLTAIIREEPPPLPETLPAPVRWTIERLLAKEREERYDSTRDLYRDLKQLRERLSQATSAAHAAAEAAAPPKRRHWPVLAAIAIAFLALGMIAAVALAPDAAPGAQGYVFTPVSLEEAEERSPAWSPDGKSLAYTMRIHGIQQVVTRTVGAAEWAQVTNAREDCTEPAWSRDGATVYYTSGGSIWSVPASGGSADRVLENAGGIAIHPDGQGIVFRRDGKLWAGSLHGGSAREFRTGAFDRLAAWKFSPDGTSVALVARREIWILPYPSGEGRLLLAAEEGVLRRGVDWFPDGRSLLIDEFRTASQNVTLARLWLDGARRPIHTGELIGAPSLSSDGKRIAYMLGDTEWDVVEVSLPDGGVRFLVSGGGVAWWPHWSPSGKHFLFAGSRVGGSGVEDRDADGRFSRKVLGSVSAMYPQWSPDGSRIVYTDTTQGAKLKLSNASGGQEVLIDGDTGRPAGASWSPDSQWIAYLRQPRPGRQELVKRRAAPGSVPVLLADAKATGYAVTAWSPTGEWILYPGTDGLGLITADGKSKRTLSARRFDAYNFSPDGRTVYGVHQNTTGEGAQWQLFRFEVNAGGERMIAPIHLPASVSSIAGLSLHPDGKRFLTSIAKWPFNIWMIEGFDQPEKNWFRRLSRR